ncbi:MAG: hypothetical protein K2N34_07065 [Lachnospiraceae bacterium]|nr:hypothetical protein [Lachnospiraceae bacterium]
MKVLYIVGTCLSKNTSANMSHNSYIQGLLENGCDVEIIMKDNSWGQSDALLKKFDGVKYNEFGSENLLDKIIGRFSNASVGTPTSKPSESTKDTEVSKKSKKPSINFRSIAKRIVSTLYPKDKVYPFEKVWLKKAQNFRSNEEYDLVVSNSSPSASHKLAKILIERGHIKTKRWVQIWEDPWFHDLYSAHEPIIRDEEEDLLNSATEIYYVSPLTTEYQKQFFPSAAHKMKTIALPYFTVDDNESPITVTDITYGYFGDYFTFTRNLKPFFNALEKSKREGFIYGDSNLQLTSLKIDLSPRVTLDKLKNVQNKTSVLVHLSNLRGGQIPGKIYHYSATTKPILFILDGTDEEKKILKNYFGKFNRYYFCENTEDSILQAMTQIEEHLNRMELPINAFSPKEVVKSFL